MNYCPNCGADLTEQYGFDPDEHEWTCTECGYEIQMSDESTSGIDMFAEMAFNLGEAAYNKGKLNDATKEASGITKIPEANITSTTFEEYNRLKGFILIRGLLQFLHGTGAEDFYLIKPFLLSGLIQFFPDYPGKFRRSGAV